MAAPPPAPTAVLLPRPLPASVTELVFTSYSCPFTVIELRVTLMEAFPLNFPADLASVTVPVARAPDGITCFPPTTTGAASETSKWSPGLLVFELTDWSAVTAISVPASTTMGLGARARLIAFSPPVFSAAFDPPADGAASGVVPELLHPESARSAAITRYRT